jgi:hypothetical protein
MLLTDKVLFSKKVFFYFFIFLFFIRVLQLTTSNTTHSMTYEVIFLQLFEEDVVTIDNLEEIA